MTDETDEFFSRVGTFEDERAIRICGRQLSATGFGKYRCGRLIARAPDVVTTGYTTPCHHCDQLLIVCTCHPDSDFGDMDRVCTKRTLGCVHRSQIK